MPDPKMPAKEQVTTKRLGAEARTILSKLPDPDAVPVMEDMLGEAADNNNNNNNNTARPEEVTRGGMVRKISELPNATLRGILRAHGIID